MAEGGGGGRAGCKAMLILFKNTTKIILIISLVRLLSTSLLNTWCVSTELGYRMVLEKSWFSENFR